jgi:uncharacterized protein
VDKLKEDFIRLSIDNKYLSNEVVNGREILIFKLKEPLKYNNYEISLIELPYPKDYPEDNWEHIEFVIPCDAANLDEFEEVFQKQFPDFNPKNFPTYKFTLEMPKVEGQLPNPTIGIEKKRGLSLKFHSKSLEEVINKKTRPNESVVL